MSVSSSPLFLVFSIGVGLSLRFSLNKGMIFLSSPGMASDRQKPSERMSLFMWSTFMRIRLASKSRELSGEEECGEEISAMEEKGERSLNTTSISFTIMVALFISRSLGHPKRALGCAVAVNGIGHSLL